jgi:hypothetical protein
MSGTIGNKCTWRGIGWIGVDGYEFQGFRIGPSILDELRKYVENHSPVGSFLTAVICNNLIDAIGYADEGNRENLPAILGYLYNEAPSECWGSRQKMGKWLRRKEASRRCDKVSFLRLPQKHSEQESKGGECLKP